MESKVIPLAGHHDFVSPLKVQRCLLSDERLVSPGLKNKHKISRSPSAHLSGDSPEPQNEPSFSFESLT